MLPRTEKRNWCQQAPAAERTEAGRIWKSRVSVLEQDEFAADRSQWQWLIRCSLRGRARCAGMVAGQEERKYSQNYSDTWLEMKPGLHSQHRYHVRPVVWSARTLPFRCWRPGSCRLLLRLPLQAFLKFEQIYVYYVLISWIGRILYGAILGRIVRAIRSFRPIFQSTTSVFFLFLGSPIGLYKSSNFHNFRHVSVVNPLLLYQFSFLPKLKDRLAVKA